MAYDEKLAQRVRQIVFSVPGLTERKMFGGLCFTVNGHMACGVQDSDLVVRVGPDSYQRTLARKHTRPMDFTGKPMRGYVYVSPQGLARKDTLARWVLQGVDFVETLPAKKPNKKKQGTPR